MRLFIVTLFLITFLACALACVVLTPIGGGDDEFDHFDYVAFLASYRRLPDPRTEMVGQVQHPPLAYALMAAIVSVTHSDGDSPPETNAEPRGQRDLLGRRTLFRPDSSLSQEMGLRAADFGGVDEVPAKEHLVYAVPHRVRYGLRVWSVALGLVAFLAGAAAVSALTGARLLTAFSSMAVVCLTPAFVFTTAMLNNDATLHAITALAIWRGARAWRRNELGRSSRMLELGLLLGLAFLVKLHAIGAAAFLFFLVIGDRRLPSRRRWAMAGILVGVTFLVSGWWQLRQAWLLGSPAPEVLHARTMPQLLRGDSLTAFGLLELAGDALRGFFGVFGPERLETVSIYYLPLGGALLLAAAAACFARRDRPLSARGEDASSGARVPLFALGGGVAVLVLGFVLANRTHYHIHGRYLFSLAPLFAAVLVLGWRRLAGPRGAFVLLGLAFWNVAFTVFTVGVVVAGAYSLPVSKFSNPLTRAYIDVGGGVFDEGGEGGQVATMRDGLASFPEDDYRVATQTDALPPLRYRVEGLDPNRNYRVRVRYPSLKQLGGDLPRPSAQALLADGIVVHGEHSIWNFEEPLVFDLPRRATADGKVELAWASRTVRAPLVACAEFWVEESPVSARLIQLPKDRVRENDVSAAESVAVEVTNRASQTLRLEVVVSRQGRVVHHLPDLELESQGVRTLAFHTNEAADPSDAEPEVRVLVKGIAPFISRKASGLASRPRLTNASLEVPDLEVLRPEKAEGPGEVLATMTTRDLTGGPWRLALRGHDGRGLVGNDVLRLTALDDEGRELALEPLGFVRGQESFGVSVTGKGAVTLRVIRGEAEARPEDYLDRLVWSPAPGHPERGRAPSSGP